MSSVLDVQTDVLLLCKFEHSFYMLCRSSIDHICWVSALRTPLGSGIGITSHTLASLVDWVATVVGPSRVVDASGSGGVPSRVCPLRVDKLACLRVELWSIGVTDCPRGSPTDKSTRDGFVEF